MSCHWLSILLKYDKTCNLIRLKTKIQCKIIKVTHIHRDVINKYRE